MAQRKSVKKVPQKPREASSPGTVSGILSNEERAALREYVQERKSSARRGGAVDKAEAEAAVLAKIAEMPQPDRALAERIHKLITASAPNLAPKLWYSMPAYANEDGQVICFFQNAQKFKTRYCTLGFSDKAHLDDGSMWPTSFALTELTAGDEARIVALVKQAAS